MIINNNTINNINKHHNKNKQRKVFMKNNLINIKNSQIH